MGENLRYLRFKLFYEWMAPVSHAARRRRMAQFASLLDLRAGDRVIDLGGTPQIWDLVETPLKVTIVNIPGAASPPAPSARHDFKMVEGDACDLSRFADGAFDIAFSNSVIEHVGDEARQSAFASEARRLARRYWVQTPSIWFPVEAHTGVPLWFVLPQSVRDRALAGWRRKLPEWAEMVAGTTVIPLRRFESLFPDGRMICERSFGFPKSNIVFRI